MRFILPLSFLVGCTIDSTLTGEEEILISALSGEEEVFSNHDIAARGMLPSEDMPKMFRECDSKGSFEKIFAKYDEDGSSEIEEAEEEKVCDGRKARETKQQRRAQHMMKLLTFVYDLDDDKELSETEKEALFDDFSERCDQIHQTLLEEFDTDGDGVLSGAEQEAAREEARSRYEEGDRHTEREEDEARSEDGERPEEGERAEDGEERPDHGKKLPPFAKAYDVDGDGALNESEKENFRAEMRETIRLGEPFAKKCGDK